MNSDTRKSPLIKAKNKRIFESVLDQFGKHFPKGFDRKRLQKVIAEASGARGPHENSRSDLHKIANPLDRVIKLLDRPQNWDLAIATLAEDRTWGAFLVAELRFVELLRDLRNINRAALSHTKREAHRPSKTKALHVLVAELATYWETESGQRFKSIWHKENYGVSRGRKVPITPAAAFVSDVVELVLPRHLHLLPKVMEKVVAQRRAAISTK